VEEPHHDRRTLPLAEASQQLHLKSAVHDVIGRIGDGDGPSLHMDYYNSYVIHPMMLDVLRVTSRVTREWSAIQAEAQIWRLGRDKRRIRRWRAGSRSRKPSGAPGC